MTKKFLCATDGTDHSAVAVILAAEAAKAEKAHLTICAVNVAHGGGRGPTINHWPDEELDKILTEAAELAGKHGATKVEVATIRSREAATGIVNYAAARYEVQRSVSHLYPGIEAALLPRIDVKSAP